VEVKDGERRRWSGGAEVRRRRRWVGGGEAEETGGGERGGGEVEAVKRRLHTTCNIKPAAQKLTLLHLDGFPAAELSDDKAKLSAYNPLPLMTISVDVSEPITESAAAAEQQPPQ